MKKTIFTLVLLMISMFSLIGQVVIDIDGNVYDPVIIGSQVWLNENLKVTHYQNGDYLPNISDQTQWDTIHFGARCYYENDSSNYSSSYGPLYNWWAVIDERNICPTGWHPPTDSDWHTLINFLDPFAQWQLGLESQTAGGDLKEAGTIHWNSPNSGATNVSGFTALPGGFRADNGDFNAIGNVGYYWTSNFPPNGYPWYRKLQHDEETVLRYGYPPEGGLSVRCVRDSLFTTIKNLEINSINGLKVYPNPASKIIHIEHISSGDSFLKIFNGLGALVYQCSLKPGQNRINISQLKNGFYFLKSGEKNMHLKLIKQ